MFVSKLGRDRHPGYKAGNWYMPAEGTLAAGAAIAASNIRLLPFTLHEPITISDLGCRITTLAAGGNIQLAIYAMSPVTKLPTGPALAVTGSIVTDAANAVSADITGANVTLQPGHYFMAVIADATAGGTVICQTWAAALNRSGYLVGSATHANITGSAASVPLVYTFAHTFGTWPDLTGQAFVEAGANSSCVLQMKAA